MPKSILVLPQPACQRCFLYIALFATNIPVRAKALPQNPAVSPDTSLVRATKPAPPRRNLCGNLESKMPSLLLRRRIRDILHSTSLTKLRKTVRILRYRQGFFKRNTIKEATMGIGATNERNFPLNKIVAVMRG